MGYRIMTSWGWSYFNRFFLCLLLCILLTVSCSRRPEEIRIGVIVTTGMELMLSSTLNAVEMARSDLEQNGGLLVGGRRHPVRFIIERIDGGVPEQAVTAASRLINRENVVAIIGPQYSSDAIPAGEVAERAHVPLISALSTHPGTTAGRREVRFPDSVPQQLPGQWSGAV